METLPWIRVSKILSESLDELVDELTVFIFELVSANGNDIGETVKYIIRELDTMNYNLFRGSCLNMLDTGLIRNNYLNRRDIAIDVGIVTLIKLLMEYIGLEEIQNSNVQELKEYFSEEKRSDFENRLRKEGIEESKITQGADKLERSEYLSSQKDSILYMLNKNSVSNAMEAVIISGRKWESIVERIKNDTFDITEEIGKYYKYVHRMKLEFPADNKRLGKILYALAHCSVSPEFSIEYTVADPEKSKNELLAAAVKDSQAKASVLTEEAGVNLGKIITIDYSWGEIDFVSRPLQEMSLRCCEPEECESASYDMDIEPDDIDISDTVTVIWGLED